jgi:hypothetical protein|uniref:Uncharacterized protein n=1 Tax=Siphoviridae sp. ct6rT12 TaxID=2825346 RepID=A0A8S5V9E0_9CAUD|nr:MAG TPA: hypothetical protein [Siphoviridae sp. ct6rT12]DAI56956.1 MAG TPA: hypothetical protein [Bacteriophage sp.]
MSLLSNIIKEKKEIQGVIKNEEINKFQKERKKNIEQSNKSTVSSVVMGSSVGRNVLNPIQTGSIKGGTFFMDMMSHPKFEEIAEQNNNDINKIFEQYKEETKNNNWKNSQIRKKSIERIKKNREEREKFINNSTLTGKGTMLMQNIIEGASNPINWINPNSFMTGLAWDLTQGFIDSTWEKTEVEEKDYKDFTDDDYKGYAVDIVTTGAIHGITKGISKGLNKITEKNKITNLKNEIKEPKTPLEAIKKEVITHGPGATNPKAIIEIAERIENGETIELERNYNFSQEVDDFYTNVTEKRLDKINKLEIKKINDIKNKSNTTDFDKKVFKGKKIESDLENDIHTAKSISKTLKPIKRKIQLNAQQVQAEYTSRLAKIHLENGGNGYYKKIGDLNELIVNEYNIDGKTFKSIIRNNEDVPEQLKSIANEYRNIANDYINLKYGKNLDKKGYSFDIVYDKNKAMYNVNKIIDSQDIEPKKTFVYEFLKNTDKKVYLTELEAKKFGVGRNSGVYELDEQKLVEKFRNDINATTQDIRSYGNGKIVDYEEKSWVEVATHNAPLLDKEKYFNFKELEKKEKLPDDLKEFVENYEDKAINWLDGVLDEMDSEVEPIKAINRIYKNIINERSGFNTLKEKLEANTSFIEAHKTDTSGTAKNIKFQNNKTFKDALNEEIKNIHNISADIETRKFSDIDVSDKILYNFRNLAMYKFLANFNYIKEIFTNKERINSGMIDLGFNQKVSILKSGKEMARATKNVVKKFKNLTDIELDKISNPIERLQLEAYIDKVLETEINFKNYKKSNILKKIGDLGAKGQTASDIQRIALSEWFTANAIYKELPNMRFEEITPAMRQVLFDMGIDNLEKFTTLQSDIKSINGITNFIDVVKNKQNNSYLRNLFTQLSDINGKELNAYDSQSVRVISNGIIGKYWAKVNSMFRMYNMNILSRTLDRLTTYIDSDGFTRYRFMNDSYNLINQKSLTGLRDWKMASRLYNSSTTALGVAGAVYGINWLTGKATGTSTDEIIEAKMEALMSGEIGDTVIDVIRTGLIDNTGLEITMGGENVLSSLKNNIIKAEKRNLSSNLTPVEKILYGTAYIVTPNAIARGIDNIKFEKNITSRIDTVSEYTKDLWKNKYKDYAISEQEEGVLPIEKLIKGTLGFAYETGKKLFDKEMKEKTNFTDYFNRHPEQAERFGIFEENTPTKVKVAYASGIMELTEYAVRNDTLNNILSTSDTIEEREQALKEYGMDYRTQMSKMSKNNRKLFNAVVSYTGIDDVDTIVLLMNEFNEFKTKEERSAFMNNFIQDKEDFEEYLDKFNNDKKYKEIGDRVYEDNTEGYIFYLQSLRDEM